jgi:aspartyl-tRNA(Asn)/glutamyl-tRNA(Gln) amidotransferase subunit A
MSEFDDGPGLGGLSAQEMLAGFARKDFSPTEVIDAVITRLRAVHGQLNVLVVDLFEQARAEARLATAAWQKGEPTGPLCGVPVTIKDLIYVRDVRGSAGSVLLKDFVTPADAAPVERLRRAGAILTGKTTTCESGYKLTADSPLTGITRNPWRQDRTSGGSSGGAAAAVAAGAGPLALGTDGVGSIRVPASFCGIVGLKPSFGLVPRSPGFSPPSWASLAHTGPIARTIADVALMLEVVAGYDARDAASLPVAAQRQGTESPDSGNLRIAFSPDFGYAPVAGEVAATVKAAVDALADAGEHIEAAPIALDPDVLESVLKPIAFTEQAAAVGTRDAAELELSEPGYRAVVSRGRQYRGVDYIAASYRRGALREKFRLLFESHDILITPTVPVTAFPAGSIGVDRISGRSVDAHLGWSPFTWPINLAGLPAATVPIGFDSNGLPIGLQIVAPWLREDLILHVAAIIERIRPWAQNWPTLKRAGSGS